MIPKKALEIIDRTLRDVMDNDLPFGGKTFILGGDFKQVLPVVKNCSRLLTKGKHASDVWSRRLCWLATAIRKRGP